MKGTSFDPVGLRVASWMSACCLLGVLSLAAGEWTQYRGPNHDGTSSDRITKQWSGSVTNPVWVVHLTNGLTSLTISKGRVFTQVARNVGGNKDVCLALNATNGAQLWATVVDNASYPNGGVGFTDDGPRSTPTVDGDSVYVLSSYHKLCRLNASNGAIIWSTNLLTGFGGSVIAWQSAASPVIEDGLVFVNANCGTFTLMAFDTTNGALVWRSQNEGMTHSTPALATIHGVRQIIFATQSGLVALNPKTGVLIWKFAYPFSYTTSVAASPVVHEDMVFLSAFYGMGGFAARIVQTATNQTPVQLWYDQNLENHWASPVCYQGAVFGQFTPDGPNAELRCLDLASGETRWAVGGFGRGSCVLVGTNLLAITERGQLVLAEANTNAYVERARFQAIPNYQANTNKCWNALSLSDGQVFVRSTAYAARYDLAVPELTLDSPQLTSASTLQLTIRTATGTAVQTNRLNSMEVRATTNTMLSPELWTKLTNALVLTNGIVRMTNVDATTPRRFFIVREPK